VTYGKNIAINFVSVPHPGVPPPEPVLVPHLGIVKSDFGEVAFLQGGQLELVEGHELVKSLSPVANVEAYLRLECNVFNGPLNATVIFENFVVNLDDGRLLSSTHSVENIISSKTSKQLQFKFLMKSKNYKMSKSAPTFFFLIKSDRR